MLSLWIVYRLVLIGEKAQLSNQLSDKWRLLTFRFFKATMHVACIRPEESAQEQYKQWYNVPYNGTVW